MTALSAIESQLTEAAKLYLTGGLSQALYNSTVRGCVAELPKPEAPHHIMVLKKLKAWTTAELITPSMLEELQRGVIAASRRWGASEAGDNDSQSTTTIPETEASSSSSTGQSRKRQKQPTQKNTLFSALPGATRTFMVVRLLVFQNRAL